MGNEIRKIRNSPYWKRSGTTIEPRTADDILKINMILGSGGVVDNDLFLSEGADGLLVGNWLTSIHNASLKWFSAISSIQKTSIELKPITKEIIFRNTTGAGQTNILTMGESLTTSSRDFSISETNGILGFEGGVSNGLVSNDSINQISIMIGGFARLSATGSSVTFNPLSTKANFIFKGDTKTILTIDGGDDSAIFNGGLIITKGTTPAPSSEGSLFLDTDAGANGTLKIYSNGAWRNIVVL